MDTIAQRLSRLRDRIARAALEAGRDPETVRLVAVSKKHSADAMRSAYEAGQRDFGENYVQEMLQKSADLADLPELRLHFIGHLQRNKVKQAARVTSAIHTVDSVRLVEALAANARSVEESKRLPGCGTADDRLAVFVQVNVSGEAQKSGCQPAETGVILDHIEQSATLRLAGLMTIPPLSVNLADARRSFDALAELRVQYGGADRLPDLSMGMSADLEEAIAAGATWVRIGTALFGERPGAGGQA